jgi:hypothetical protein
MRDSCEMSETGRRDETIEESITDAMIEAGLNAYCEWGNDDPEMRVVSVYKAMRRIIPSTPSRASRAGEMSDDREVLFERVDLALIEDPPEPHRLGIILVSDRLPDGWKFLSDRPEQPQGLPRPSPAEPY